MDTLLDYVLAEPPDEKDEKRGLKYDINNNLEIHSLRLVASLPTWIDVRVSSWPKRRSKGP